LNHWRHGHGTHYQQLLGTVGWDGQYPVFIFEQDDTFACYLLR
jgi:hypothetical protein